MNSKYIQDLRKSLGLSRERFGRLINVSHSTIRNWERGYNKPSPLAEEKLEKIAREIKRKRHWS